MDIGILNDHVIVVSLVVAVHKLTPVLHRHTEETLNHLRESLVKNSGLLCKCMVFWTKLVCRPLAMNTYFWLSFCVLQDGHWIWVGHGMTHNCGSEYTSQISAVHLCICALGHPNDDRNNTQVKY